MAKVAWTTLNDGEQVQPIKNATSFCLALIISTSPGTIFHITQMRTELMAMLLMLISLIFLNAHI